jgi:ribose transport system substrate-binding protein
MTKLLNEKGDVALITGISGDVTSNERMRGFKRSLGDGVHVVQSVSGKWKREVALQKASTVLRSHPDLKGFFVANDDMALGVVRAVANAGKTKQVRVVSVDGIKDGLKAVKSGSLDATVAQYPYAMGVMGIEACQGATMGKKLPDDVKSPVALVTKKNADKALQSFPKPFASYDDPYKKVLK